MPVFIGGGGGGLISCGFTATGSFTLGSSATAITSLAFDNTSPPFPSATSALPLAPGAYVAMWQFDTNGYWASDYTITAMFGTRANISQQFGGGTSYVTGSTIQFTLTAADTFLFAATRGSSVTIPAAKAYFSIIQTA